MSARGTGLEVKSLRKKYRFSRRLAVDDVSFAVEPGEVYALVGPNGAGKSTVIKCVLGLVLPQNGKVLFRGKDIKDSMREHLVGYMPDRLEPYPFESFTEFAAKYIEWQKPCSSEESRFRMDRVMELAREFRVSSWKDKPFYSWSLGMKQRAFLSLVLATEFSLLILDEPTQALDPVGRKLIFDQIRARADEGASIIVSSHLLSDLERIADKAGLMYAGRLLQEVHIEGISARFQADVTFLTQDGQQKEVSFRPNEKVSLHDLGERPTVERISAKSSTLEAWYLRLIEEAEGHDAEGRSGMTV